MCFFPSGSALTVRRWSQAPTPWSRRTARRNTTASSSPTCCCSVAPVLTRRCSASALVATTWKARWRCAKTAYSRIAPADGGVWMWIRWHRSSLKEYLRSIKHTQRFFLWQAGEENMNVDHIYFLSCWVKLSIHVIHQQHSINKGRCLSSKISHVGSLHISMCTCLQVHCSSDTPTPRRCPIHLFLKLCSLGRITLDWHTEGPHTHANRGLRRTQFYTVKISLFWTEEWTCNVHIQAFTLRVSSFLDTSSWHDVHHPFTDRKMQLWFLSMFKCVLFKALWG